MTLKSDAKFKEKLTSCLEKWHEEFGKFSPERLKVLKLELWWDPFVQSRKYVTLKSTEELSFMKMKRDIKFGEESTWHFKLDRRNLTNLDLSTQTSQRFSLYWGFFEQSMYCLSYKSTEELSFMKMKRDKKFGEESTWALKRLKDFHFNGFFLSIVCIVWAKKVQRSYHSWNWRGIKNLERNQLLV